MKRGKDIWLLSIHFEKVELIWIQKVGKFCLEHVTQYEMVRLLKTYGHKAHEVRIMAPVVPNLMSHIIANILGIFGLGMCQGKFS